MMPRFSFKLLLLPVLAALSLAAPRLYAQDTQSRLEEINARVEKESTSLKEMAGREAAIEAELKEIGAAVKKIQAEENALKKNLEKKKNEEKGLRKELSDNEKEVMNIREASLKRIRVLFMHRDENLLEKILLVSGQENVQRNAFFLAKIKNHDKELIDRYFALRREKENQILKLSKVIRDQESVKLKIESERAVLKEKLAEQEDLAGLLKAEKVKIQESIAGLRAQALRLETVVMSLTGKESPELPHQSRKKTDRKQGSSLAGTFEGPGLAALRGKLEAPVRGSIFRSQSDKKSPEFKDMLSLKGVHFATRETTDVRAVAKGRIIYVGKMPGLGDLLILDHGTRFYSLYGRLTDIEVSRGDIVDSSDVLARTEPAVTGAPNFYFEIRKNGVPEDTLKYLKK